MNIKQISMMAILASTVFAGEFNATDIRSYNSSSVATESKNNTANSFIYSPAVGKKMAVAVGTGVGISISMQAQKTPSGDVQEVCKEKINAQIASGVVKINDSDIMDAISACVVASNKNSKQ